MKTRDELVKKILNFERKLQANMKNIYCPTHLSIGHEEVAADLGMLMIKEDWLFSTHRNHHHYLAKGGNESELWDEIMGLPSGLNGGFAGSQAITDRRINFHASAILGGLIGVATGVAYSLKSSMIKSGGAISICCIGDAATEQGVLWEALNFSSLYKLPILFVCENNGKSVDALIEERQSTPILPKIQSFGLAVYENVTEGLSFVRRERLPAFVEVKVTLECAHLNMATMLDLYDKKYEN